MSGSHEEWRQPAWRRVLRFWGPNVEADVDEELRFHIEMRVAELERRGVPREEAMRRTLDRFGSLDRARGECRDIGRRRSRLRRRTELWGALKHDVLLAVRGLRKRPGWSASVVVTLGLGLAAAATVFSIVNAFLLRPLPVRGADRLVAIATIDTGDDTPGSTSYPTFQDIRALGGTFDGAVAWASQFVSVRAGDRSERRSMTLVSDDYFDVLGVRPALGRFFTPAEARAGEPLVVLSHDEWRRHHAGDSGVVGRATHLNGMPATIVGVAPASFQGTQNIVVTDLWVPVTLYQRLAMLPRDPLVRRESSMWKVMARLAPGVSLAQGRAALDVLAARIGREFPDAAKGMRLVAEMETRSRPDIGVSSALPRVAAVFMALVALVLLVACANVAGLLLARTAARQGELAVRSALGAGRGRLVRQLLTETMVLGLVGAAVGIALAMVGVRALGAVKLSTDAPVRFDIQPDWRVFAFALAASIGAALVAGLLPALRSTRAGLSSVLRDDARGATAGRARQRTRGLLVAAQVAVTFLLLVSAGLLVRGVQRAVRVDLGFRTESILLASADVSLARHDQARGARYFEQLAEEVSRMPGVRSVALGLTTPLGYNHMAVNLFADVPALAGEDGRASITTNSVTPGFFETLGVRLLEGRDFTVRDDSLAPRVAVVNAELVRRLWPDGALGRQFRLTRDGEPVTIVGVVADTKEIFVHEEPRALVYFPFAQRYDSERTLFIRTAVAPTSLVQSLRERASALDPDVALYDVKSMHAHLHQGIAFLFSRLGAALAVGFGVLALVQALAGLYGLLAYQVSLRTREIGVRIALGARARDVLGAVLGQGVRLTLLGLAAGLALALASTRLLGGLLNGVSARDPLTFGGAALVLLVLTAAAALPPARRASRVAPGEALRGE